MKRPVLIAVSLILWAQGSWGAEISTPRRAELLNLLKHDCGSCHGLSLKGGLGPALTPDYLVGKPIDFLVATILYGRPGTPMPPWRPFLSDPEAFWLAEQIKAGVR
ncbi:MAG: cytochrome c [Candidatus Thiodiazotropha sp.]|nr:cytochrome c [Candidatus Thiodiazotropha sp.]MCM8885040.1 cytochrome c [Candidatus Thiodiazotropha sp.]MCM8921023.1 cytochrome c [Candidatus Thiodiazotropha sp.]